ncbi:MAG: alcohol dehydrogenase catalytic domain-containing protein [Micromonosporaceae bacterium]|nr:alcohol dehydrogenase catalytic domain-containing protein [Micromonosporaceae bacterium]
MDRDTIRAVVRAAPRVLELRELPAPPVGPGEVRVRIRAVGICGGDLHYFEGRGRVTNPNRALVVGHEGAGVVDAVGPGVADLRPGDRVVIDPQVGWCGHCDHCLRGARHLCPRRVDMGYMTDGACRDLVTLPRACVYPLPHHLAWDAAVGIHGLAATVHALEQVPYRMDASVVVLGTGPAGLYFLQLLAAGWAARQVVAVGRNAGRLALARRLGAHEVVDARAVELVDAVAALTPGGADLVVEATGAQSVQERAVDLVAPRGTVLTYSPGLAAIPFEQVVRKEVRLVGSTGVTGCMRTAVRLVAAGKVDTAALVTDRYPLTETQAAFEAATADDKGGFVKAMVTL